MKMKNKINKYIFLVIVTFLTVDNIYADNAPIIQPGAPGENSKKLDPETATSIARTSHIDADIKFLQGMIVHHEQAIVMSKLAAKRTNNKTIIDLANRIDLSQVDEINFMESWLSARDKNLHEINHKGHMHMSMPGMATPAQIES